MTHRLLPIFMLSVCSVSAQERTTGSGGEAGSASGTVSYSIGLIDYTNQSSASGAISAGVQQPYELFALSVEEWDLNWNLSVFPNPTTNLLFIESQTAIDGLSYVLTDAAGKTVQGGNLPEVKNAIDLGSLANANYFLQIRVNENQVRTYQISKN